MNNAIAAIIPENAWKSTVAIIRVEKEKETLHQFGTGTLFRVADESFRVTAGHIAKYAEKYDIPLCVPTSGSSFVQLHGNWICSADGQYGVPDDPFDIAIHKLDSNVVEKLAGYSFLRLAEINYEDVLLSKGIFALFGYPFKLSRSCTSSDIDLLITPFQFVTYAYEGTTEYIKKYQERFHILLNAEPTDITSISGKPFAFTDREGNGAQFPKELGGISGCSVWWIGSRDKPIEQWSEEKPKIVALETGVYPRIIKATRWVGVSTLIHSAFPELRPALDLWYVG